MFFLTYFLGEYSLLIPLGSSVEFSLTKFGKEKREGIDIDVEVKKRFSLKSGNVLFFKADEIKHGWTGFSAASFPTSFKIFGI